MTDKYEEWYTNIKSFNIVDNILIHEYMPNSKNRRQEETVQIVLPLSLRPLIMSYTIIPWQATLHIKEHY